MASCPNCGSNHIQLMRETNVSWGRAITGLALFGVVGSAVGAVTGEDRNANACLDCGTSWKAEELYKTLQFIKNLTDINLDLSIKKDRLFLNYFISQITPYIEDISKTEIEAEKIVTATRKKQPTGQGFVCGCIFSIIALCYLAGTVTGGVLFLILLIMPLTGFLIDISVEISNQKFFKEEIESDIRKAGRMKIESENKFKRKVEAIAATYFMS